MKKLILAACLACLVSFNASAQEVLKEIEKISLAEKNDSTKDLTTRRIASFKVDAVTYLRTMVAPTILKVINNNDSTSLRIYNDNIKLLNEQSYAMYQYVNLFFKRLSDCKKKNRDKVVYRFRQTNIENSLFNDEDKDLVLSWYNREDYPVPFSLDCDWIKSLEIIRNMDWSDI